MKAVLDKLQENGMNALFVPTAEDAKSKVLQMVPEDATVGIGGSVTIRQLGLIESLRGRGNTVHDHWESGLSKEQSMEVKRAHLSAEYFLSSSNALTMDGKLVNIDNTGNRVAALVFGPRHVIVVLGINKIVQDVEEGIRRVKERVAPLNCQRRGDRTPCAEGKNCQDCNSPDRICRVTSIIEKRSKGVESFSVIIVGEELGY